MRSTLALPMACALGLVVLPGVTAAQSGALNQLASSDACIGKNVYVASGASSDAVAVFARGRGGQHGRH